MIWPDPSQRYCCAKCRQPIVDPPMLSADEIASRHANYLTDRAVYRARNPHASREDIEAGTGEA